MITVHKYPLQIADLVTVDMPQGAECLTVQTQYGRACLWARVDTDKPMEARRFRVAGTGHSLTDAGRHIGSCQIYDGDLVFHVFEA